MFKTTLTAGITSVQIAKYPSASLLQWQNNLRKYPPQKFKRKYSIKSNKLNVNQTSDSMLINHIPESFKEKLVATIFALSKIIQMQRSVFNPPESSDIVDAPIDSASIQEAILIITGDHYLDPLFSTASNFVSYSQSSYPAIKTFDLLQINIMMVKAVMSLHSKHFQASQDPEIIALNIFQEAVQNGLVTQWSNIFNQRIQQAKMEEDQKLAATELLDGITSLITNLSSGISPLDKYIDQNDHQLASQLNTWLRENDHEHPNYTHYSEIFEELREKIWNAKKNSIEEGFLWMFSKFKQLCPELQNLQKPEEFTEYFEETRAANDRDEFSRYILKEFSSNELPLDFLRKFNQKIHEEQYNEIVYAVLCENQSKHTHFHQIILKIWKIFQLDTINLQPSEAMSRMPNFNFSYDMQQSPNYQKWMQHPLANACGDVVMDAFHTVVNFGCTFDIDIFVNRFLKFTNYLDYDSSDYQQPCDNLYFGAMGAFKTFLLENIYKVMIKEHEFDEDSVKLKQSAGSMENFREKIVEILVLFQEFSKEIITLNPLSKAQNPIDPFVFGIGFNGIKFFSARHDHQDKNEIWIHFPYSRRNASGDLFLTFLISFTRNSGKILSSSLKFHDAKENFKKYKPLMQCHISSTIKGYFEPKETFFPVKMQLERQKKLQNYENFLSQLEQEIPLDHLDSLLKQWIRNIDNWYSIPFDISVQIAKPISEEESYAQHITRELLFDIFCERTFSTEHAELMDWLFLHWKHRILSCFKTQPELFKIISDAKNLNEINAYRNKITETIDKIILQTHGHLKQFWQNKIYDAFQKYKSSKEAEFKKENEISIKKIEKQLYNLNQNLENARKKESPNISKIEEQIEMLTNKAENLKNMQPLLLTTPTELSLEEYNMFKRDFFDNRSVSQCIEPGFAKVLGHEHFFSILISREIAKDTILSEKGKKMVLGTCYPQSAIPPCNKSCQHHAMGHLYIGDMHSHYNIDRLDFKRQTHGLGDVPNRFLSSEDFSVVRHSISHFQPSLNTSSMSVKMSAKI